MTDEQRRELKRAIQNEFVSDDEDKLRQAYREMGKQLAIIQEEMGISRYEALMFVATMLGQSMRPQ